MIQYFKRIASHTLIYGIGDVAVKAIGFLLIPLYTRYLTPDDYGIWSLVHTFQMILIIVFSLGFNSAVFKVYHQTENEHEKDCVVSTALIFLILWGVPATGLLLYGAEFLSRMIFGSPDNALYLRYIAGAVFLDLFRLIALSLLRAREKPVSFSIINIIHFTLLVILNILNVAVRKQGVTGIVQSQLITSAVIAAGTGLIFLRRF